MKTAVVTGASSGIGAATALALVKDGWHVVIGARRVDRLAAVAAQAPAGTIEAHHLDVTDQASVSTFVSRVADCQLLVNNAGGAKGMQSVAQADIDDWHWMYETNVIGTVRMTKALLPKLLDSGDGMVITVASIAGHAIYAGGAGYNAAKHAEVVVSAVLREELAGLPIRICEVNPGLVETEFSLVRFNGDAAKADAVYTGITAMSADDIAEAIRWVAAQPSHVNIDNLTITARDQVGPRKVLPKQ